MSSPARAAIKAAFLELLEERPLRDITVKDIVQACGINRNSFYYHFKGIPELLEEIVSDCTRRIIAAQGPAPSLSDCLEASAAFALEHRQAVLHIAQSTHRELFELCLMDMCRQAVLAFAAAAFGSFSAAPEDRELLVRFCQCTLFGQIIEWLNSGMRYDMRSQFRRLCQLGDGMIALMLRRAAEGGSAP